MNLSKKQNKHLRELAGKAYELELSQHLSDLHSQFDKWKSKEITVWDLSDRIHDFHDGDSRDLYKHYVYGKNYTHQVARALHNGIITIEDVEESCREHMRHLIDNCFKNEEEA